MKLTRWILAAAPLVVACGPALADMGPVISGSWVIDTQDCATPGAEHIDFRDDGGVEVSRDGDLIAMGFWNANEDSVVIDLVAEPAFLDARLTELAGQHFAFQVRVFPFQASADELDVVGILGQEVIRAPFTRCLS